MVQCLIRGCRRTAPRSTCRSCEDTDDEEPGQDCYRSRSAGAAARAAVAGASQLLDVRHEQDDHARCDRSALQMAEPARIHRDRRRLAQRTGALGDRDDQPEQPHPGGLEADLAQAGRQDQVMDSSAAQRRQRWCLRRCTIARRLHLGRRELGWRMKLPAALVALALCTALPAAAQPAGPPQSPPPPGVPADGGAGHPKGHYHELDGLPDWGGIWFVEAGASRREVPATPKLKGEYLARYQAWREQVAANDGVVPRTRSNCSPPGMPRIMRLAQYPYEFLFTPGRVTVNQEAWMQTRTIWTDGRAHKEDPDPTFMGDSIGRWEGDTLVVDTIGILDELEI